MSRKTYWNYRVLIHNDNGADHYALHEVFYTDDVPDGWTTDPIDFGADSMDAVRKMLGNALGDAQAHPPLRIVIDTTGDEPREKLVEEPEYWRKETT